MAGTGWDIPEQNAQLLCSGHAYGAVLSDVWLHGGRPGYTFGVEKVQRILRCVGKLPISP